MRELIYLSDRKLNQFVDDGKGGRRRLTQIGATAPMGLGGLQVGLSEQTSGEHPRLVEVVRHLEKTAAPRPFTDEDVRPGEWVRFRADMIYRIFHDPEEFRGLGSGTPGPPALLFWDPQPPDGEWPTRLLLHGSPEHLVGTRAGETPSAPSHHTDAMSSPMGLVDFLIGLSQQSFSQTLSFTLSDLDRRFPIEVAARVTGFARVTANVKVEGPFGIGTGPRVVVASPLFVELAK